MGGSADEQTDPRFLVGQVLAGRYWLQEHLGRGAMGDVFRARHAKVPRTFAVKVLHPELVQDPKVCRRFEREAELAGRLHHRNVVSVIDVGETARSRYLVMEFAEGVSLVDVIAGRPMSTTRVLNLAKQICDGLQHAHEHELVHRDLKPENIIVERTGDDEVPRIVDFGLAILRDAAGADEVDRLTTRGIVLGTPHYLAPETAMGEQIDHRIDLFALGVILYEMLTGVMPFDGDGVQVAQHNLRSATPVMSARAPGVQVDPLLEALVGKLMEKKPSERPQSAREVRSILELIENDREKAGFLLGVKTTPATQPLPAGLRDPSLNIVIGAPLAGASPSARPTANGVPLERISSPELTERIVEPRLEAPREIRTDAPGISGGDDVEARFFDGSRISPTDDDRPTMAAQRDVVTDRVRPRTPKTTAELLRASGNRKREVAVALAAIAALAIIGVFIMRRGDSADTLSTPAKVSETTPVTLPVVHAPPAPLPAPVLGDVPPANHVVDGARPRKQQQTQARVAPQVPTMVVETPRVVEPPRSTSETPRPSEVLALYQALGRELKAIADRRDMTADDLWVRYRRVRIQDAMTDTAKRGEAQAILSSIDRELAERFRRH